MAQDYGRGGAPGEPLDWGGTPHEEPSGYGRRASGDGGEPPGYGRLPNDDGAGVPPTPYGAVAPAPAHWEPGSPPPQPRPATPGGPGRPPGGPPGGVAPAKPRRRRRWLKRAALTLLALVVLLAGGGTWLYFHASGKLHHEAVLSDYAGRPAQGGGDNWLIVGSDSRAGLSRDEQDTLHVGSDAGQRTDSMMLLHHGSDGTVLVSLPRDSYVSIPAWTDSSGTRHAASKNKLNAAYAFGGAPLLAQTVEEATGIRIDHYAEVGFAGFVTIVDTVGGVQMCLDQPIVDKNSGANLKAGCQTLNGAQALSYVRARYFDPLGDLGRMERQRQFLSALAHKVSSAGVLYNPFKLVPVVDEAMDAFTVDNGTGVTDLYGLFQQMQAVNGGSGKTMVVPIGNASYDAGPSVGDAVLWDTAKAKQLFTAIENDSAVPDFPAT